MACYVAFINSKPDTHIFTSFFKGAVACRVQLHRARNLCGSLPKERLWIDTAVDGFDVPPKYREEAWRNALSLDGFDQLDKIHSGESLDWAQVASYVHEVMDSCMEFGPAWLSVPQVPIDKTILNRKLAQSVGDWKRTSSYRGCLLLPVILRGNKDYDNKTFMDRIADRVRQNLDLSEAEGLWIVDRGLSDFSVTKSSHAKFDKLIRLHEKLGDVSDNLKLLIGGPYWALNLVLWARGLIHHPAIAMGGTYQYPVTALGKRKKSATKPQERISIPPLRRLVVRERDTLARWLDTAASKFAPDDSARKEFTNVRHSLDILEKDTAKRQIARFYASWVASIESVPSAGRALALYQDLSAAYVVGKSLPRLPTERGYNGFPYAVAEALMLVCLG